MANETLPESAVPWRTALAGMGGLGIALALVLACRPGPMAAMLFLLGACAAPMWWLEHRRVRRERPVVDAGPDPGPGRRRMRFLGGCVVAVLLGGSVQLQIHLGGPNTGGLAEVSLLLVIGLGLWLPWLALRPTRAGAPPAAIEDLATVVWDLFRHGRLEAAGRQCLLGWCVKAFFLPLMLAWLYFWLLQGVEGLGLSAGWHGLFVAAMALLYAIDTAFATIGYVSTSRSIDAHIRSTDATWLGWLSALACYPPLSELVLRRWLEYKDGFEWTHWLSGTPWLLPWAMAILVLTAVYTSASVVFGPRFSNLTHRGIITTGPYRWTKHPAYLCKNLSWWLIAVPFVADRGLADAVGDCLALLGVNFIYWLRARTEERHLMHDPVYRHYAAWIAEHGLWARIRRCIGSSTSRARS